MRQSRHLLAVGRAVDRSQEAKPLVAACAYKVIENGKSVSAAQAPMVRFSAIANHTDTRAATGETPPSARSKTACPSAPPSVARR